MPKLLKKPHTPNEFTMEKTYIFFRPFAFYEIAVLRDHKEERIILNPEQHYLLLLLSAKKFGYKYHRIAADLFADILDN